ncbi:bifunctional acetate--CoA ligase family protein/GNAT family N-acetyltransferase [Desulfosarcina sp.]|uniref:bifunctional acetate--CoA ligase family protein/GNAT family N-acetyltransferase n=1 Tax=Desulfosarcina sp. TaxID=2027861 RepID=UPI0029A70C1A|nr:bifunctional acetate--CoA ligase family protein/GNAT family N-acetyltransferase [Desulfosarcina sp.]MDX2454098.1 bifunctional acetate--CoA ligase family protein/GNAT family N-acetyltransferase [Desulfosarcina sp.]MDX2491780.1 bifunctional acetate--CoA ligase family protein/GNAT family N-acetyltransferase [Desulfosarcina sp.]
MTVRNLKCMFNPAAVALVGASQRPGSIGTLIAKNLVNAGFKGDILPVNPKYKSIEGLPAYPDVQSLPKTPELAVIATPPDTVPGLIEDFGRRGTRSAVVITAGFGEGGSEKGERLCGRMLDAARPHLLRIVGPNCLGIMVPGVGLNASFGHVQPLRGNIAFVAQSGAIQTSVLDWATSKGIGFSHFVSVGDMSDVDFGDMLDYLTADYSAKAILLYIEAITHARKFMSAARAAARVKPVIVVKAGRHVEGARAAASHTGALAGADDVYDAAFQRAGMLRVMDMQALFDAVETLAMSHRFSGDRLAILTNGGGVGVLATDVLIDKKGCLAELSPETMARLNSVLPHTWSHNNPVDIIGDAPPERYTEALTALLEDKGVDAILVLNCPTAVASSTEAARAVVDTLKANGSKAASRGIFTSWLGLDYASEARKMFAENRIPTYDTPADAVRGFMQLVRYRRSQEMLMETPPTIPEVFAPQTDKARGIVDTALSEGRIWLTETEAKAVLAAYQIPVVQTYEASTPEQAAEIAARIGGPVALKILSPDITHKSDVGGVALDLASVESVQKTAWAMQERIRENQPGARITGFTVQPMIHRPNAHELIVGISDDVQFGPVILFGQGGTAVEIIQDKAIALPPLNMHLAREVMTRARVYRLLEGYRGKPAADLDSIALTLVKVSQLISDIGDIVELDINPLLADEQGVVALDARIKVVKSHLSATQRLAIRPYPKELEETLTLSGGQTLLLRPIRPEDEPSLQALFANLSMEEIRLRFLHPMKILSHKLAARLTQIDYDREMAMVLCEPPIQKEPRQKEPELFGVVRFAADPDNERAEFAILLRRDMTGMGLGPMLMRRIIDYAKNRGIGEIFGEVLAENRSMLRLCKAFGFTKRRDPEEPGVLVVELAL